MILSNLPHKTFTFPVGEMQVNIIPDVAEFNIRNVEVTFTFTKNEDIIELLLYCDAVKRMGKHLYRLHIPYVPFSRQDRVNHLGESFTLAVFANLINSLGFERVVVHDPHSDVTPALIHNCEVVEQWEAMVPLILNTTLGHFWLVSPDAGALKKIYKLPQVFSRSATNRCQGVIEGGKSRNTSTGEISGTVVHCASMDNYVTIGDTDFPITYCIVDDICDGGRTFIELAKALRSRGAKKINLYVTHGFFTKGKQVFDNIIDHVYAVNDRTKGDTA